MNDFAARIRRLPLPVSAAPAAAARARFAALPEPLPALLAGAAGSSPYLSGLMEREGDWLAAALHTAPEAAFAALLSPPEPPLGSAALAPFLRQMKRRAALLIGLADLAGLWPLEAVTGALTKLADQALTLGLAALWREEEARGHLPPGRTPESGGYVILAMGKMGAGELNYSSDIDLICLFDDALYGEAAAEIRPAFLRLTKRLMALISEVTGEGYVFRTDLRLRPDAAVTPVCLSFAAAEAYYEAEGRSWERAAYIKARPAAGDLAAGARFLQALTPFVWRRHLDFAAIEEAHAMRLRIRDHRGLHGPIEVAGHNLKLGPGGIREIEFFTQTRQLIAGGREGALRPRETCTALRALAAQNWLPPEVAEELIDHYRALREVEHRLQMIADVQTHDMPTTPEGLARIAALCGAEDDAAWTQALKARLLRVDELTEGFYARESAAAAGPDLSPEAQEVIARWQSYPALKSPRAQAIFDRLRPALLTRLLAAANPSEALASFDGFLAGLPAGVQLFSLFEANPPLVDLIADIAATAPGLARYLARHAAVLDAVIGGRFFAPWPALPALTASLAATLAAHGDYEQKLDALKAAMKEWHFRIGVHHLRGLIGAEEAGGQYAALAEAVIAALWPVVCEAFAARHGPPPGRGAVVIGMGSLGAGRLHAASDLDLLVLYDGAGAEVSEGPKPLPLSTYYARLTQALITALSAPTAAGKLYETDMRLRPSGRKGPVATSLPAFLTYQQEEAWAWEHLALTRARALAGPTDLQGEFEAARRAVLAAKATGAGLAAETRAMLDRLEEAKPGQGGLAPRRGRGRMTEIELCAAFLALKSASPARRVPAQIEAGRAAGLLSADAAEGLARAYRLGVQVLQPLRLLASEEGQGLSAEAASFVLREIGAGDLTALALRLAEAAEAAEKIIARLLPEAAGQEEEAAP